LHPLEAPVEPQRDRRAKREEREPIPGLRSSHEGLPPLSPPRHRRTSSLRTATEARAILASRACAGRTGEVARAVEEPAGLGALVHRAGGPDAGDVGGRARCLAGPDE